MGVACIAVGGGERRVPGFGGETWGKETTWGVPGADEWVILRWISGSGMWG
jgi:hypothetical protein